MRLSELEALVRTMRAATEVPNDPHVLFYDDTSRAQDIMTLESVHPKRISGYVVTNPEYAKKSPLKHGDFSLPLIPFRGR